MLLTIGTVAADSALPAGGNLLLSHLRLCIGIQLCCYGVQSFCPGIVSAAGQIEDKRSDLEWHVFIRGQQTHWLGFEHPELIIPRVYLDTPANRQRSNDVSCVIGCRFMEHGGGDGYSRTTGDPVAQMRAEALELLDWRRAEGERVAFELFQHARGPMVGARAAIERRSGRFGIAPVDRATDGDDVECAGLRGDVLEPALELARLLEGHVQVRP